MSSNISEYPLLKRDGNDWILVLKRVLEHPREEVWSALTEADQIPSWGPFTTDRNLTLTGEVRLAHIDMPEEDEQKGYVLEVSVPELLVFRWGDDILRWELSGDNDKTILILRHRFADREQAPSYAAGWHLCFDGLAGTLAGEETPSMVGHNAIQYGYEELYKQYAKKLGISLSK